MIRWKLITISSLALLLALAISHQALYKGLIIPRLNEVKSVPIWWWFAMCFPIFFTCLTFGWKSMLRKELVLCALLFAILTQGYITWASYTMQPPFTNQPAATSSSIEFWTSGLFTIFLLYLFLNSIAAFTHNFLNKRTQHS